MADTPLPSDSVVNHTESDTASGPTTESNDSDQHTQKKARLDLPDPVASDEFSRPPPESSSEPNPSPFLFIPPEIFAEILLYTRSPKDILAMARTCRAFCHTLLEPSSKFIWRQTRKMAKPCELPDFEELGMGKRFSEVSYAAFVYDGGTCEVCEEETSRPFVSYALRIRLCPKPECGKRFVNALSAGRASVLDKPLRQTIPVIECEGLNNHFPSIVGSSWPYNNNYDVMLTRVSLLTKANEFWQTRSHLADVSELWEEHKKQNDKWMTFCTTLVEWKRKVQAEFYLNKKRNDEIGRGLAREFGWEFDDMLNCTDYGPYHRHQSVISESISIPDVNVLKPKIEDQLFKLEDKRQRQKREASYRANRTAVIRHYNRLRSSKAFPVIPALSAFRQLPIITMLQQTEAEVEAASMSKGLQDNAMMQKVLNDQIRQWVAKAKDDLGKVLGAQKWKTVNKNLLHPVDRPTARFKCKRCDTLAEKYIEDECMDFAGACAHDCVKPGKKNAFKWDVQQFERDDKAIAVVRQFGRLFYNDEVLERVSHIIDPTHIVICRSCTPPIVMHMKHTIGHCHRHEDMELSLNLSPVEILKLLGSYKFIPYYTQIIMGPTLKGRHAQDMKIYGCRHCYSVDLIAHQKAAEEEVRNGGDTAATPDVLEQPGDANDDASAKEEKKEKEPYWFNFNGLRSHLKAKHLIETVRDEDYFFSELPQ